MYADKKSLSLMIMTLCLASLGYIDGLVFYPKTEVDLDNIVQVADKRDALSVIYIVMDDADDLLLHELADKFQQTVFLKVDPTVVKFEGQVIDLDRQPDIMFHKYGRDERPFFCNNPFRLEILIQHRIDLNKTEYFALSNAHPEVAANTPPVQGLQYKNYLHNVIQRPKNTEKVFDILQEADRSGVLCLVYLVTGTHEHDGLFNKMARRYNSTVFIKIDIFKFSSLNGLHELRFDVKKKTPSIIFYRFGHITNSISSTNEILLSIKILDYRKMQKNRFEKISKRLSATAEDQFHIPKKQQHYQAHSVNGILRPPDSFNLFNIMEEANRRGKLCLIYLVIDTDVFDQLFEYLAKFHSSTVYIKIDITKMETSNGFKFHVNAQPKIYFYKFKRTTKPFSTTNVNVLSKKIEEYEKMEEAKFVLDTMK